MYNKRLTLEQRISRLEKLLNKNYNEGIFDVFKKKQPITPAQFKKKTTELFKELAEWNIFEYDTPYNTFYINWNNWKSDRKWINKRYDYEIDCELSEDGKTISLTLYSVDKSNKVKDSKELEFNASDNWPVKDIVNWFHTDHMKAAAKNGWKKPPKWTPRDKF